MISFPLTLMVLAASGCGAGPPITAPVVANRVGQLAYREQSFRDDLLTKDEMAEHEQD